jgi:hypothetical protein
MRGLVAAVLVAAAAAASAAGSVAARDAPPGSHARLVLTRADPLRVHGRQFRSGERVRLTARARSGRSVARVRASTRGAFAARFADVTYDPCSSALLVVARGSGGSVSTLKVTQRECPPKL